jgi:hypothetical protein
LTLSAAHAPVPQVKAPLRREGPELGLALGGKTLRHGMASLHARGLQHRAMEDRLFETRRKSESPKFR